MPILIKPARQTLGWNDFTTSSEKLRDHDAEAGFEAYFIPDVFEPQKIRGKAYLPATYTIQIDLIARKSKGITETAELLAHEQVHYDVGFACAKALARALNGLSAANPQALLDKIDALHKLHMLTRAQAIQKAYDNQTDHGKNAAKQQAWEVAMAQCLASPTMARVMGLPL